MATLTKPAADYNDTSFDYQNYWQNRQYEHLAEEIVLKRFFKQIKSKETLVDLGGGFGRLVPFYAPFFQKAILIDPSERLLKEAKKLEKEYENLKTIKAKANNLPIKDKEADLVLLIRAAHHLPSLDKVFQEINRVLKPNGFFVLEFANKLHLKAIIRALFTLNFYYLTDHTPIQKSEEIIFYNLHPTTIVSLLKKNKFKIKAAVSVSNFRSIFLKKILPLRILLFLEKIAQRVYPAYVSGPSVFILAQK